MKQLAYSSTAAFLAHYRLLSNAATGRGGIYQMSVQDDETLDAMHRLMNALTPEERTLLLADTASTDGKCVPSEARRRLERAQLKLRRLLLTKGVVRS
jgi:hypothetical protein